MSLIDCKVEIGIDDSGIVWTDISSYVQSVQINRGRSRQLDYFSSGSATIVLKNASRTFDPLNEDSPFYPDITPRCLMRISSEEEFLFTGFVNDWDLSYDIANQDIATALCSDVFTILANQQLRSFTPSTQLSGARVNTVLARSGVDFTGTKSVSTGLSTLGNYLIAANTNVLNYLRQIERSELGSLFVSANGTLVFRERGEIPSAPILEFSDDGTHIPYLSLENQFGDELLYNYVIADSPAGSEQIKSDATSIAKYQTSQLNWSDLLNNSTTQVANIAQTILSRYKDPKVRFTGFSVQILGLSSADKLSVLAAELTDFVELTKSFAEGTPSSVMQLSVISGIRHDIRPGSHVISFTVENAEAYLFLILGDAFAGRLDFGQLDF